jgi:hypothetical protein
MNQLFTSKAIHLTAVSMLLQFAGCQTNAPATNQEYGACLDSLLALNGGVDIFQHHAPMFHAECRDFEFHGPNGPYREILWLISDRDRHVALYKPGEKPYLDVFSNNPHEAPDTLIMPERYHNATLLGTRLTTSNWYDKWAISGDEHSYSFSGGGDSLTLTETQRWSVSGAYRRDGYSAHIFTFKCDPKLGYVVDMDFVLVTDDSTNRNPEFINFMPRDVVNPWPGENRYTYTIYTPPDRKGYYGYANNLYAGNLSDEKKTDWGKGFEVKPGGFIGMIEKNTYSPVLFRYGNYRFVQRTCDAWLDQHNHVLLPPRGPDGTYRIDARFLFAYLPPAASDYVIDNAEINTFSDRRATMIRLGITEDFEDQPLPLTATTIGLTKGFWEEDFVIDTDVAYSGRKSLRIDGRSENALATSMENFIRYPQIPLETNTTYRISVMARTSSPSVQAWISAETYEWTPYDPERLSCYKTNTTSGQEWQLLLLEFRTPSFDPFVDLRFQAIGNGMAWFDDFRFAQTHELIRATE